MTAQAAERALNSVEASQPHQDAMEKEAKALTQRWDEWFDNPIELADARELVTDTRQFLRMSRAIPALLTRNCWTS